MTAHARPLSDKVLVLPAPPAFMSRPSKTGFWYPLGYSHVLIEKGEPLFHFNIHHRRRRWWSKSESHKLEILKIPSPVSGAVLQAGAPIAILLEEGAHIDERGLKQRLFGASFQRMLDLVQEGFFNDGDPAELHSTLQKAWAGLSLTCGYDSVYRNSKMLKKLEYLLEDTGARMHRDFSISKAHFLLALSCYDAENYYDAIVHFERASPDHEDAAKHADSNFRMGELNVQRASTGGIDRETILRSAQEYFQKALLIDSYHEDARQALRRSTELTE